MLHYYRYWIQAAEKSWAEEIWLSSWATTEAITTFRLKAYRSYVHMLTLSTRCLRLRPNRHRSTVRYPTLRVVLFTENNSAGAATNPTSPLRSTAHLPLPYAPAHTREKNKLKDPNSVARGDLKAGREREGGYMGTRAGGGKLFRFVWRDGAWRCRLFCRRGKRICDAGFGHVFVRTGGCR